MASWRIATANAMTRAESERAHAAIYMEVMLPQSGIDTSLNITRPLGPPRAAGPGRSRQGAPDRLQSDAPQGNRPSHRAYDCGTASRRFATWMRSLAADCESSQSGVPNRTRALRKPVTARMSVDRGERRSSSKTCFGEHRPRDESESWNPSLMHHLEPRTDQQIPQTTMCQCPNRLPSRRRPGPQPEPQGRPIIAGPICPTTRSGTALSAGGHPIGIARLLAGLCVPRRTLCAVQGERAGADGNAMTSAVIGNATGLSALQ